MIGPGRVRKIEYLGQRQSRTSALTGRGRLNNYLDQAGIGRKRRTRLAVGAARGRVEIQGQFEGSTGARWDGVRGGGVGRGNERGRTAGREVVARSSARPATAQRPRDDAE